MSEHLDPPEDRDEKGLCKNRGLWGPYCSLCNQAVYKSLDSDEELIKRIEELKVEHFHIWTRRGLFYYARLQYVSGNQRGTVERKLDFIAYWLIKLIHGDEVLKEMALAPPRR